jgi:hypothetical protein
MGADIYLQSIYEPWMAEYEKQPLPALGRIDSTEDLLAACSNAFDDFRASGGYFRNGYNSGDVMMAMGLSWWGTVLPMLDADGRLPIDRARELLAMIEARPLTREVVALHYLAMAEAMAQPHADRDRRAEIDSLHRFVVQRREELLTILRKSIELNEPLVCSL